MLLIMLLIHEGLGPRVQDFGFGFGFKVGSIPSYS